MVGKEEKEGRGEKSNMRPFCPLGRPRLVLAKLSQRATGLTRLVVGFSSWIFFLPFFACSIFFFSSRRRLNVV